MLDIQTIVIVTGSEFWLAIRVWPAMKVKLKATRTVLYIPSCGIGGITAILGSKLGPGTGVAMNEAKRGNCPVFCLQSLGQRNLSIHWL